MSESADTILAVPAGPVLRSPKGPTVCSLHRPSAETLVLGPARRAGGWPSRADMSLGGWLVGWAFLSGMILMGGLLWLLILGLALCLPVYWATTALESGLWGDMALAVLLEAGLLALLVLAVLAVASTGRWVTFDRRRGLLTVSKRPFGWRRPPRVVQSRPLSDVKAVQLVYGGISEQVLPQSPYDDHSPLITQQYDWYEFDLVFRDPTVPRMSIASGPDWVWMRQAGREVAEFLGVPLIDHLYHGPST